MEARPPTANRLNGLGMLLLRREDWAGAHERFRQAVALDSKRPDLRNNAAVALVELGRGVEAEPIFSGLAEAFPRDPIILQNHARSLIAVGRLDEAEARLDQAEALMVRGGPYRNKGDPGGRHETAGEEPRPARRRATLGRLGRNASADLTRIAVRGYIRSTTRIPSRSRPNASVRAVKSHKANRLSRRSGDSALRTGQSL